MSKRKRQEPSDSSDSSSSYESHYEQDESDNEDDEYNAFIVKGLKTKLNDQPDEIMDHIFSFLVSEEDDTVKLSLSMVSHKFRKAWMKTLGGVLHQCRSLMKGHAHRNPHNLNVLKKLKQSIDGLVHSVLQPRIEELEEGGKEQENKNNIEKLIVKCKEKDKERAERLMPILNRITKYEIEKAESYWDDKFMWSGAELFLEFDNSYSYHLIAKDWNEKNEINFSPYYDFWEKVNISKEDMLWLIEMAFAVSNETYFYADFEFTMDLLTPYIL